MVRPASSSSCPARRSPGCSVATASPCSSCASTRPLATTGRMAAGGDKSTPRTSPSCWTASCSWVSKPTAITSSVQATRSCSAGRVTGVDDLERSRAVHDGAPAWVLRPGRSVLADVWQTGGPLASVLQGGDAPGPWQREPVGGGVLAGMVTLGPGVYDDPANWHVTDTVDVDVVMAGAVELRLPELPPVVLRRGDVVVQRGVLHRWQPVGDETMQMGTMMI